MDELRVLEYFLADMPKKSQASFRVYKNIFPFADNIKVTQCLKILYQSKLLTKENFTTVANHKNLSNLASVLFLLDEAKLLTKTNFTAVINHKNLSDLASVLSSLNKAKLLTEPNFNAVINHDNPFITNEQAMQKFLIIVREELKSYLKKLSNPQTKEAYHEFRELLDQLEEDGINSTIWDKLKPQVTDRVFDEFKDISANNKENSDFLLLLAAGQCVELYAYEYDLNSAYQEQIVFPEGYREYCSSFPRPNVGFFQRSQMTRQEETKVPSLSMDP